MEYTVQELIAFNLACGSGCCEGCPDENGKCNCMALAAASAAMLQTLCDLLNDREAEICELARGAGEQWKKR